MSYDYEEELKRARAIRQQQRQAKLQEQTGAARGSRSTGGEETAGEGENRKSRSRSSSSSRPSGSRTASVRDGYGRETARSGMPSGKKPGKSEATKKKRRIITMIILEVFTLFMIFGYAAVYKIYSTPQRPDFVQENIKSEALTLEDIQKMQGYWMIAIFGVDSRGTNVGKGTNADVNMICCINQDTGDIKLVSVFRDSYLNIDDSGTYNKINAAYANGGPEQAVRALNKNLDLNITDYITFNWKGVADAINILGGVDLEISKAEFRYINSFITETVKSTGIGSNHLKSAGMNHLDGVQAVAYGRLRLMDTDFARTERQRKIIKLAFEKAKKADYSVLNNILVVVLPQVATSLDFADLTNVALNITKYQLGETAGFPMARGDANLPKKGAVVVPATLDSNVTLLHNFLFGDENYTPSDSVKNISAKIASDTGVYKEGQVIGHVSTEGVLPKETTAPQTAATTEEETEYYTEPETDEFGDPVIASTEESSSVYPGIGETDEFGDLIDGPDDVDPDFPPTGPTIPGDVTQPGTRPTRPDSTMPSDDITGPGVRPTEPTSPVTPGESTAAVRPGGDTPETTTAAQTPGGNTPGGNTPGGGSPSQGGGPGETIGNSGPGE